MVDKKLVATIVSSREAGLKRRAETVTTSSHEDKKKLKNKLKKTEFASPSKARTARNSSLREAKKTKQTRKIEKQKPKAKIKRCTKMKKKNGSKLMLRTLG